MAVSNTHDETIRETGQQHASVISFTIVAAALAIILSGLYISSQFEKPDQKVTVTYNPETMEIVSKGDYAHVNELLGEDEQRAAKAEAKVEELQNKIDGKKPEAKPSAACVTTWSSDNGYFTSDGRFHSYQH